MKTATISIATTDYYVGSGGRAVGRRDVGAKDQCKTQEALHAKTGNNGAHGRRVQKFTRMFARIHQSSQHLSLTGLSIIGYVTASRPS